MDLVIVLQRGSVLAGESVPLEFRLSAGPGPLELPQNIDTSEAVAVALLDAEGAVLARADGLARWRRQQPIDAVRREEPSGSMRLEAGETAVWDADLLAYLDPIAPGRYLVSASFSAAGGEVVVSPSVPLHVRDNHGVWMDVLVDTASMPMVYVLQQHLGPDGAQTLFQLATGQRPECFWYGGAIDLPDGARPLVAEVDFRTMGAWDHDLERWGAWLEEGSLRAFRFGMGEARGGLSSLPTPYPGGALAGRPIQREDGGLSVLVLSPEPSAWALTRLHFDRALALRGAELLARLPSRASPTALAAGWDGRTCFLSGEEGSPPVRLVVAEADGAARSIDVLTAEDIAGPEAPQGKVHLLSLKIDLKSEWGQRRAILVTALVQAGIERWLSIVEAPLGADAAPTGARRSWRVDVDATWLSPDEALVWADTARDDAGRPVTIVATSAGRLLHLSATGEARVIPGADPDHLTQSKLVELSGQVILFHPVAGRGFAATVLVVPSIRPR